MLRRKNGLDEGLDSAGTQRCLRPKSGRDRTSRLLDCRWIDWGTQGVNTVSKEKVSAYWKANLRYVATLLAIWFIVSYGCGILLVNWLDQFQLFGFPLGFWFAQQGSIYVFVVLIFVYVGLMNKLDRQHDVHED